METRYMGKLFGITKDSKIGDMGKQVKCHCVEFSVNLNINQQTFNEH